VPSDESEAQAKLILLQLQSHKLKQYPSLDTKQRDAGIKVSSAADTCWLPTLLKGILDLQWLSGTKLDCHTADCSW
jgi:hypothetical protein